MLLFGIGRNGNRYNFQVQLFNGAPTPLFDLGPFSQPPTLLTDCRVDPPVSASTSYASFMSSLIKAHISPFYVVVRSKYAVAFTFQASVASGPRASTPLSDGILARTPSKFIYPTAPTQNHRPLSFPTMYIFTAHRFAKKSPIFPVAFVNRLPESTVIENTYAHLPRKRDYLPNPQR